MRTLSNHGLTAALFTTVVLGLLHGCSETPPAFLACAELETSGGIVACATGWTHRASAAACTVEPSEGKCSVAPGLVPSSCQVDADCVAGPNGRCGERYDYSDPEYPEAYCGCSYQCATDADCAADELCLCQPGRAGSCKHVGCRIDADCGSGLLCADVLIDECGGYTYRCQTPFDECMSDADCPGDSPTCLYAGTRRTCSAATCSGDAT